MRDWLTYEPALLLRELPAEHLQVVGQLRVDYGLGDDPDTALVLPSTRIAMYLV